MKKLLSLVAIGVCLSFGTAYAADDAKKPTGQQSKMATCNKDAGEKKLEGDPRKAFMKECLSAKPAAAAKPETQQSKMATCNKDAGEKKLAGDPRKAFMKECLSKKA